MQKRTGTKLRNAVETSSFSCAAKYSPTAKISSYVPTIISFPASKGRAVRPSVSVRTVFKHWLPLPSGSSRQSTIDILAAGRPRTISSTWVVRPPVILFPPIGLSGKSRLFGLVWNNKIVQTERAYLGNFAQCYGYFLATGMFETCGETSEDTVFLILTSTDYKRKPETVPICLIQSVKGRNLFRCETIQTRSSLFLA